jgi:hypothetical protein
MAYVFDPAVLHDCSKRGIGLPPQEMFTAVTAELDSRYQGLIEQKQDWIFNNAGGAMGVLTLLYASFSEYLIFFGSPIGTEGHSGRYSSEVYDFMMDGEMWCYTEGQFERTLYKPGDAAYLGKSAAKGYCIKDHAWMLEYSRGCIPLMFPFGLADSVWSTLDGRSIGRIMRNYCRLLMKKRSKPAKRAAD